MCFVMYFILVVCECNQSVPGKTRLLNDSLRVERNIKLCKLTFHSRSFYGASGDHNAYHTEHSVGGEYARYIR